MAEEIVVVGGGLAGSEAAWQAAQRGVRVHLYEMRPVRMTPAHHTDRLAELVCSNSLRSDSLDNAVGVLKEEMRRLGSLILAAADKSRVPAGSALAVDREEFSRAVTEAIAEHPLITLHREEVTEIPAGGVTVVATGPLTSDRLAEALARVTGSRYLYFFDAAAPIVTLESLDLGRLFRASRYNKGEDYLNAPLTEEEYRAFYTALVHAEVHVPHDFEQGMYFEGCLPVEELARRGEDTLRFGPMKPVGLRDPRTGKTPYAVVQLRQDNREGTLYNIVGFQTKLTWPEQRRVFRMIPGLEQAEFVRYGVVHRNTYVNSPRVLKPTLQVAARETLLLAGQITGVEGYVESAAMGLLAGINAARLASGQTPVVLPRETVIGSLAHYITTARPDGFQPMNATFGLLPAIGSAGGRKERNRALGARALAALEAVLPHLREDVRRAAPG